VAVSEASDLDQRILARRAELLARPLAAAEEADLEVAVCEAGAELCGFPLEHLREIVPRPPVTPLPFAPPWLEGVAQVRGRLLGVVALAPLLGAPARDGSGAPGHLVVADHPDGPVGFAVGRVLPCRRLASSRLRAPPSDRVALGLTTDRLLVLDVPRLLALPELVLR
jgi:chemotaxis signal transduction protein